jgi:hypothetical protein
MAGIVTLTFQNAKFTGSTCSISVSGGTIVLEAGPSLSLSGTIPFTNLSIASGAISIDGQPGSTVNGNIGFPVNMTGNEPTITVTNFSGTATISWPSNTGGGVQQVPPGDPVTLNGFRN